MEPEEISNLVNRKTDVLIVGAGPTGLMAANQLLRFGIDFIIIDKKSGPTKESRAILVTARSLEIYQQMGIADHATNNGVSIKSFNLFYNGKRKTEVKIGELGKGQSEFSYMLAFEQSKNEELLSQNILKTGKEILWNHEYVSLTEHDDKITVVTKNNEKTTTINAKYLIACDGAKSPIRHQLNFNFKGGTYDHQFFVVDTILQWDLGYDKLIITPGKKNFCAFLPLQGNQTYRVLGTLPKEFADKENIEFKELEKVIIETIGVNLKFEKVNWFSTYKLHHRAVEHFSQGNIFLAGDSAHIHSPAGGQGMNTGLQDVYNLCWKLALVLNNRAHKKLLDTYNKERLPFANMLLKFTDRGFNMMTNTNWFIQFFRKHIAMNMANLVLSLPKVRQVAFKTISQTGYSYKNSSLSKSLSKQKLNFKAGDRLPFMDTINSSNKFYELFKEPSFHLLHIGNTALESHVKEDIKNTFPFSVKLVESSLSETWQKHGVKHELFILVRPDNYMAFIFDSFNKSDITHYCKEYFL